jgi:GxxExxY protein
MSDEFEPLSGRSIHAAIAVHRALGPGFLESIYHNAMRVALNREGIAFETEAEVRIFYDDAEVGIHYLDLLVEGQIVVEFKAVKELDEVHYAQIDMMTRCCFLTYYDKRVCA